MVHHSTAFVPGRLDSRDCVIARSEDTLGGSVIQSLWLYDRQVDLDALRAFHAALQRGRLGRVIVPATIGAAGDRWTSAATFAPLRVDTTPIDHTRWVEWQLSCAGEEVNAVGGPAWRLSAAPMDNGGSAVSLVVSHRIADGQGLWQAIADAVAGVTPNWHYRSDTDSRLPLLVVELGAAIRQVLRATRFPIAELQYASARWRWGVRDGHQAKRNIKRSPMSPQPLPTAPVSSRFVPPRMMAIIRADAWQAAAERRNGTGTTLAVALLALLAVELGRVDANGRPLVRMPVSLRDGPLDTRANALVLANFPVDITEDFGTDLAPLRAIMKHEFRAASQRASLHSRRAEVGVLIPRRLLVNIRRRRAVSPDSLTSTCVSYGQVDNVVALIDGAPGLTAGHSLFGPDLTDLDRLVSVGGLLRIGLVEVNANVVVTVTAYHPPNPIGREELSRLVTRILGTLDLTSTVY